MTDAPRMGDNITAPYAEGIAERLESDYGTLITSVAEHLVEADRLPTIIENSNDVTVVAAMVVKLRDLAARAVSHRTAEKEPFLRAGDAVYAFFTRRVVDPLDAKRKQLGSRLDTYKQQQLAEERARREAEAAAARERQREAARLKEAAEVAARRARSAETKAEREQDAAAARVEAEIADVNAESATLQTMQKAGRMVGERFEGERAGQVTMRKAAVVFIDDVSKLDLELLRPFLKEEHLLSALRAWAKATNYSREMPGATVTQREATVVR